MSSSSSSSAANAEMAAAMAAAPSPPEPVFDETQMRAIKLAFSGKSVFITGSAGCGKSLILKALVKLIRQGDSTRQGRVVVVTSSTGISAEHIDGVTINFFAGIGRGDDTKEKLAHRVKTGIAAAGWRQAHVLVIEEVSMISAELLIKLDFIARQVRGSDAFMGGLGVILVGDFYQLPPVGGSYVFQSHLWNNNIKHSVILSKVYRQSNVEFIEFLNEVREGRLPEAYAARVRASPGVSFEHTGIVATKLYCHNHNVDLANQRELDLLKTPPVEFVAETTGVGEPMTRDQIAEVERKEQLRYKEDMRVYHAAYKLALKPPKSYGGVTIKPKPLPKPPPPPQLVDAITKLQQNPYPVPAKLVLKQNAQVMFLKNNGNEYKNGTRGVVVGFFSIAKREAEANARAMQEWQAAQAEKDQVGEPVDWDRLVGLPVSALSGPLMKRLKLSGQMGKEGSEEAAKEAEDEELNRMTGVRVMLLSGRVIDVVPVKFEVMKRGITVGTRMALPLKLAWSITVHKSQGMSIDALEIDLTGVFSAAMAYVALSRATSLEGLKVIGLTPNSVWADERVKRFYARLRRRIARQSLLDDDDKAAEDIPLEPDPDSIHYVDRDRSMSAGVNVSDDDDASEVPDQEYRDEPEGDEW